MNYEAMVSVWCTTYNHEKYIRDAIEGFLMQKTDFKFEVVIHDDASTDGTITILREYEKKYPELIRVLYETENQYSKFRYFPQFFYPLMRRESKGKYIALCEGDDYWTDANKLQIQIDYMESHPHCVMTVHDAIRRNCRTNEEKPFRPFLEEEDVSFADSIGKHISIPTASYVCKKEMLNIDDFFLETDVGDYTLQLYCLTKGKIHYFDRAMSVYRYLAEGSWSSNQRENFYSSLKHLVSISFFLERYNEYTNGSYDKDIRKEIRLCLNQALHHGKGMSIKQFSEICEKNDKADSYMMHKYYSEIMRTYRQYYDLTYCDDRVADFAKKGSHVLIWGAGDYGKQLAVQFDSNDIEYDGFVVSDNQVIDESCQGKKVWKVSEIPFKKEDIEIVIAVRTQLKDEILKVLHSVGIKRYIYPFEINIESLFE